jgi:phosphatidylglycerophosphate synthase|tara:strand:+ start:11750 stop:12463 length:714 start_codon:yes stop_codon:yes gene_type:complete
MNYKYSFKDIVKSSVIGSHCVYVKILTDMPALGITYLIVNCTKISANFVTYIGAIFALVSAFCVLNDNLILAAIFFYISFMCDFLDGRIARIRKTASSFGKKLDLAFDRLIFCSLTLIYLYYFEMNEMLTEQLLLILFAMIFLTYDVLEITASLVNYRDIVQKIKLGSSFSDPIKPENEAYFYAFKSIKRWIPSRVGSIAFIFFLAPAVNFIFFYLIALIAISIRLLWFMTKYFTKN